MSFDPSHLNLKRGYLEAGLRGMDDLPDRTIIDVETTPGELGHSPRKVK